MASNITQSEAFQALEPKIQELLIRNDVLNELTKLAGGDDKLLIEMVKRLYEEQQKAEAERAAQEKIQAEQKERDRKEKERQENFKKDLEQHQGNEAQNAVHSQRTNLQTQLNEAMDLSAGMAVVQQAIALYVMEAGMDEGFDDLQNNIAIDAEAQLAATQARELLQDASVRLQQEQDVRLHPGLPVELTDNPFVFVAASPQSSPATLFSLVIPEGTEVKQKPNGIMLTEGATAEVEALNVDTLGTMRGYAVLPPGTLLPTGIKVA